MRADEAGKPFTSDLHRFSKHNSIRQTSLFGNTTEGLRSCFYFQSVPGGYARYSFAPVDLLRRQRCLGRLHFVFSERSFGIPVL